MSIDVLSYNVLNKENQPSRQIESDLRTTLNNLNTCCISSLNSLNDNLHNAINGKVVRPEMWSLIPTGSDWSDGFKVCDSSEFFRCGSNCEWTVPAGITCARFQLWGAGAQSGAAGCCGGSPFGGSGAYASVIMPVTESDVYTLCAGCAFCCYSGWNEPGNQNGCSSFVTGPGLTNFCAMGGIGNLCTEMIDRDVYYAVSDKIDAIPSWTCIGYLGYCMCGSGSSFCHGAISTPYAHAGILCCGSGFAAQPHLMLPQYHSSATAYGEAEDGTVYGISGAFTESCLNIHCKCGYMKHPPIYGFESTSQCVFSIQGATSCGGNYCAAADGVFGSVTPSMQIPGAGGFAMQVAGGCQAICGDAGRMGMVCVSYK